MIFLFICLKLKVYLQLIQIIKLRKKKLVQCEENRKDVNENSNENNQNSNSSQQISGKLSEMLKQIFIQSGIIARWNCCDANVDIKKSSTNKENIGKPKEKDGDDVIDVKLVNKEDACEILYENTLESNDHSEVAKETKHDIAEYQKENLLSNDIVIAPGDNNECVEVKNTVSYDNTIDHCDETYARTQHDAIEMDENIDGTMNAKSKEDALNFDHTNVNHFERPGTANAINNEAHKEDQLDEPLETAYQYENKAHSNSVIKEADLLKDLITMDDVDDNWIDCSDNEENLQPPRNSAVKTSKSNLEDKLKDSSHNRTELMPVFMTFLVFKILIFKLRFFKCYFIIYILRVFKAELFIIKVGTSVRPKRLALFVNVDKLEFFYQFKALHDDSHKNGSMFFYCII